MARVPAFQAGHAGSIPVTRSCFIRVFEPHQVGRSQLWHFYGTLGRMATVVIRQGPRGVHYDVRFRDPAGRQRKKAFRTRREADRFAAAIETDKARGGWIDPDAGKVKLEDFAAQWLDTRPKPLRPRTREL